MPELNKTAMQCTVSAINVIPSMVADYHAILILGGTKEAATLAQMLHERGHKVITSLAGRTKEPKPIIGKSRIGGFGGIEGLSAYLSVQRVDFMIDATHPFAAQISKNAIKASKLSGVPLMRFARPFWQKQQGDLWHEVPNLEDARDIIPSGATVLLALGRQHIAPFAARKDVHFIIRMVDAPQEPLPFKNHTLLLGLPKATAVEEAALLVAHNITYIVCRNSGGQGAYTKIEAARNLGIPVIILTP